MANKLEKRADDAENWNYHDNAEFLRDLAAAVRARKFNANFENYVDYLDGERILRWIAAHIEVGS